MFRPLMYLHPPAIRDAKMRSNIFVPIFSIYANFWLCFSGLTCTKYKISRSCTNIVHNIWLQILESRQKKRKTFAKYFSIKAFCNWYILFPLQKYNGQLPCHEIQLKVHGNSAGRHTVTKTWLFKNVKLSINMYVQNNLLHQLEAQLKQDLLSVVCWDTGSTVVVRPWWHSHTSKCHNFPFSFQII